MATSLTSSHPACLKNLFVGFAISTRQSFELRQGECFAIIVREDLWQEVNRRLACEVF